MCEPVKANTLKYMYIVNYILICLCVYSYVTFCVGWFGWAIES